PQRDVEDDARASGQREQREDEADERHVDRESLRDARADPRDYTLVVTRRERRERHPKSSYGAFDVERARADVGVEVEHAVRFPAVDRPVDVVPVARGAEQSHLAVVRIAAYTKGHVR